MNPLTFGQDDGQTSTPGYPVPDRIVGRALFATALGIGLSSSIAYPEELWFPIFPQSSTVFSPYVDWESPHRQAQADLVLPPTAERLAAVQDFFGLSKTELAQVCRVQRQTVYDWYASKFEATGKNAQRLTELFQLTEKLQTAGYRSLSTQVTGRALSNGSTLLGLLTGEHVAEKQVSAVVAELHQATVSRRSQGASALRERLGWKPTAEVTANNNRDFNVEDFVDG